MTTRVIQWGAGLAGTRSIRAILNHPGLELVGLYVARPERAGRDAGSFVDMPDTGVVATNNVQELLALKADCLIYMAISPGDIADVIPFLRAGTNVISTTLFTLYSPTFAAPEHREPIEAACQAGGSTFFATGASPGFGADLFPATMLGIVDEIREVRVQEIGDYSRMPEYEMARSWGFGLLPGEPIPLVASGEVERFWGGIPRDIALRMGVEIDEIKVVHETAIGTRDVPTAFGTLPAGTVTALRFEVQGFVRGHRLVTLEHVNYCDFHGIPDHWPQPSAQIHLAYRTLIRGRPNITAEFTLDYPIAGPRAVNAVPAVAAARAGIIGGADVPPLNSGNVVLGADEGGGHALPTLQVINGLQ